jgi:hypothetical protein
MRHRPDWQHSPRGTLSDWGLLLLGATLLLSGCATIEAVLEETAQAFEVEETNQENATEDHQGQESDNATEPQGLGTRDAKPMSQPIDLSAHGTFERDIDTAPVAGTDSAIRVWVIDDWAVAIQERPRDLPPNIRRPEPLVALGDTLFLVQSTGRVGQGAVVERGYFLPRNRCEVRIAGWAYVLDIDVAEDLKTSEPMRLLSGAPAAIAVLASPNARNMSPVDPEVARRLLPTLLRDLETRVDELYQEAADTPFLEERWVERQAEVILGGAEERLLALAPATGHASFNGPDGPLNLVSTPGFDDFHYNTLGTWFTYIFRDDGTVVYQTHGAHFPRATLVDPELGYEVLLTTTGTIRPHADGWTFPNPDKPEPCT